LNKATDETAEPISTRNISKRVSPLKCVPLGVKTIISQFYGTNPIFYLWYILKSALGITLHLNVIL